MFFRLHLIGQLKYCRQISLLDSFELADTLGLILLVTCDSIWFLAHREYGQAKGVAMVATTFDR
jgi:hypothetical protein